MGIEFSKSSGQYDYISPIINFTGNAALVAVGGICVGSILNVALKALGYTGIAVKAPTVVFVTIGMIGAVGTVVGLAMVVYVCIMFSSGFRGSL